MAIKTIDETNLTNIADAIRAKNGTTEVYKPSEMAAAIQAITTGGGSGGGSSYDLYYSYNSKVYNQYGYAQFDVTDKTTLKFTYDITQSSGSNYQVYLTWDAYLGYELSVGTNATAPYYSPAALDETTATQNILTDSRTTVSGVEVELDVSSYTSVVFKIEFDPYSSNSNAYASMHIYDIELS